LPFWTSKGCTTTSEEIQISFFSYISNNFIDGYERWKPKREQKKLDRYAKTVEEVKNEHSFDLALIDREVLRCEPAGFYRKAALDLLMRNH